MFLLGTAIKGVTLNFDENNHLPHDLHDSKRYFYPYYQIGKTTNPQYLENFKNKVLDIKYYGGAIGTNPGMSN